MKIQIIVVIILLAACKTRVKNFYIPKDFDGNVAVIYKNTTGKSSSQDYHIPDSGILQVEGTFEEGGVELNYYQENASGGYDTLREPFPSDKIDYTKSRIYFHRTLSYSTQGVGPVHVTAFYVGKKQAKDLVNDRIDFERKLEKLALPATH